MPLQKCNSDGKSGWRWGSKGKCYTGPGAKKKAIRQGVAIEGPDKFKSKATDKEIAEALQDQEIPLLTRASLVDT